MAKIDPSLTASRPVAQLTRAITPAVPRASAEDAAAAVSDAFEKVPPHELARSALFGAGSTAMTGQGATAAELARMLGDVAAAGPHLPGDDGDPASFGRPAGAERAQERRRLPVDVPWSPAAHALLNRGGEGFREWVGAETGRSHAAWREAGWSHYLWEERDGSVRHMIVSPLPDGRSEVSVENYDANGRYVGNQHGVYGQGRWVQGPDFVPPASTKPEPWKADAGTSTGKPKDPVLPGTSGGAAGGTTARAGGSGGGSTTSSEAPQQAGGGSSAAGAADKPTASDKPAEKPTDKPADKPAEKPVEAREAAADAKAVASEVAKAMGRVGAPGSPGAGPGGDPGEAVDGLTGGWDPRFGPERPLIPIDVTLDDLVSDPDERREEPLPTPAQLAALRGLGASRVLPGKDSHGATPAAPRVQVGDLAGDPMPDDLAGNPGDS